MRRELLLIGQMVEAAEQAMSLVAGIELADLESDRQRRDALLWNFTVLGEAAAQLADDIKTRFAEITWAQPARLRNRCESRDCSPSNRAARPGSPPSSHHCCT